MGFHLGDIQPFQEPCQLPVADLDCSGFLCVWPPESLAFQTAVKEPESVIVPVEDLDLVAQSIAEDKQVTGERVSLQHIHHQDGEPVNRFAHISHAGSKKYAGV